MTPRRRMRRPSVETLEGRLAPSTIADPLPLRQVQMDYALSTPSSLAQDSYYGTGVYKTMDSGKTW